MSTSDIIITSVKETKLRSPWGRQQAGGGPKEESRRRSRIATAFTRDTAPPPPTSILDVPDDLLELVLLRVRTPICLFRAAATCKPWRRVVAGAGFLRHFRALHGSHCLLLGHYTVEKMEVAEFLPCPPRPSDSERLRRRLSLDFLPRLDGFSQRVLTDIHGGLLAFVRDGWYAVVCDPWNRQYRELGFACAYAQDFPWVCYPGDRCFEDREYHSLGAFLLDADDAGGGSTMSGFRLLCAWLVLDYMDGMLVAQSSVYSARDGRWLRPSTTTNVGGRHYWTGRCCCWWSVMDPQAAYNKHFLGRAGGSIFWFDGHGDVLVLDESTGEFSNFTLPGMAAPGVDMNDGVAYYPRYESRDLRVVGGGGAAGDVPFVGVVGGGDLEVLTWARGAMECTVERRVGLCQLANIEASPGLSWLFLDNPTASADDLVLGAFVSASSSTTKVFSLDIETMKLWRIKKRTASRSERMFPYELTWTQSTINTCL